jgi:hypothetical protein
MILNDEVLIYRLLSYTLIGIRAAAYEGNNKVAFKLADLIDNVPGQLGHIGESFSDYDSILASLRARSKLKGMESWLDNAILNIHENEKLRKTDCRN